MGLTGARALEAGIDVQAAAGIAPGRGENPALRNGSSDPTLLGRISEIGGKGGVFELLADVGVGGFSNGRFSSENPLGYRTTVEIGGDSNNVLVSTRKADGEVDESHFLRDPAVRLVGNGSAVEFVEPVHYERDKMVILKDQFDEQGSAKSRMEPVFEEEVITAVRMGGDGITVQRIITDELDTRVDDHNVRKQIEVVEFTDRHRSDIPVRRQKLLDGEDPTARVPRRGLDEGVDWLNRKF